MSQRPRIVIAQQQRLALNTSLQASIRLLRSDTLGLTRYLEEQAAENPHLRLIAPEPPGFGDWLPRWSGVLAFGPRAAPADHAYDREPAAAQPSLIAHVIAAIRTMDLPADSQPIALALVEAIEPSGWLGRPPEAIAAALDQPLAAVLAVLARLQQIDPPGLFARNLTECLTLQAEDLGQADAEMRIILQNLDLLAAGDISGLARLCRCDPSGVVRRFGIIRAMNPKPGISFVGGGQALGFTSGVGHDPAQLREPDLLARPLKGGRWQVSLNRSALPSLEIDTSPDVVAHRPAANCPAANSPAPNNSAAAAPSGKHTTSERHSLNAAKALRHMLQARNDTLLRVGREIAARQIPALIEGRAALRPMTMAEVAEALDLHVSTISRVVAGASMDSPHGVWWLRRMFSGARGKAPAGLDRTTLSQGDGSETAPPVRVAAAALRHRLGQIIASEDPAKPMSDAALALALAQETGVQLARRTLAQYREAEGIPPAHRRRRSCKRSRTKAQPGQ